MTSRIPDSLYKSFFENSLDGLAYCQMVFDAQGNPIDFIYLEVNKNFEKVTGLRNVAGKKVTELIPEAAASNPKLLEIYGRVSATGKSEKFETYVAPLSRWFSVAAYSPKKNFFVAAFEDVTIHKQMDKDLASARIAARNVLEDLDVEKEKYESLAKDLEKFKLASDSASDQIVITDPEGTTLYINKATETLTGYASNEIIGKKLGALWSLPMPKEFYENLWKTIKTDRKTFVGELRNRRKNGEIYDAELRISPVLDKDNNVLFFVGIERDVSEVKKLIDAKNKTIAQDAAILASIGDGLIATDHDGNIILMDTAAENILGWKMQELVGKRMTDVIPRYDAAGNAIPFKERLLTQVLSGEKLVTPMADDTYFVRKDGARFPTRIVATPILNNGTVTGAVEIFRDITKEKEVDRAKSEFVSLASHQLRTPPTIIGWYTETLQSGELGPFNEKQAEYLAEIYKANQRMITIINSLLNISRIEMGTFVISTGEIDIGSIIDETVKELASRFGRSVELTKNLDPGLGLFKADPNIMQIIIDNLLSNAFKYGPPAGTEIAVTAKIENGLLLLSVKDNGVGIPRKDRGRVFEKLFRADNAVIADPDGTGLGLYMTKKIIVDGLGGKIWFDSKENEGTTFYVSLPATGMPEKAGTTTLART